MRATETALGFLLPPVLRTLYAEVANDGFGFGYGVRGAIGGFDGGGSGTIVEQYLSRSYSEETLPWASEKIRLIDLADYDDQWEEVTGEYRDKVARTFRYLILPYHLWPECFLPICNWGCVIESCLDGIRGGVYLLSSSDRARMGEGQHFCCPSPASVVRVLFAIRREQPRSRLAE